MVPVAIVLAVILARWAARVEDISIAIFVVMAHRYPEKSITAKYNLNF